ncbi:MAG: competence/damage-inducible protein A, partial [Simkania negevensis]|nr:competence/damage-inducible protein A [Simkania negevensis]
MSVELLCIGNELLSGKTLNTNANWIAEELLTHGYLLERITVLPDQIDILREGIKEALQRSSYVITTGGLGPTGDDLTLQAVASALDLPFILNKEVEKELNQRFGSGLPMLQRQAMAPEGAKPLHNPIGTAPGYFIEKGKKALFIFPGVPAQMEELLKKELLPYLEKNAKNKKFLKQLFFCPMDETRVDPLLRQLEKENPDVEIGICPSYDVLSVYLSLEGKNQEEADQKLLPLAEKIS